ncbi:MAG: outer membrane protein transport protein [bacterium]
MKLLLSGFATLMVTTTCALAGGIDRTAMPLSLLFEDGQTARLSFSSVTPAVSGDYPAFLGGGSTDNMAQDYTSLSFALKGDVNDRLAYMVSFTQPYGADANYTAGFYTGLEAHWTSSELDALLKYQVTDRISAFGGLRYVTSSADITIPVQMLSPPVTPIVVGPYTASADRNGKVGYVLGAAYEIPAIALRGSLTYQSAITHTFDTHERFGGLNGGATLDGSTDITMPQSVAFDFQTGIAADTLLFGSVKWSEWSKWHVRPSYYDSVIHDEVTGFSTDVITYQLGVGRKINDNLSVFARLGYEAPDGKTASRLSPTDGMQSIGIGGSWTQGNAKFTGGVEYVKLGNATDGSTVAFADNHAIGLGISVDFKF